MEYITADALVPQPYETMHVLKKADLSLNMQVFTELIQTVLLPRKGHVDAVNFLDIWVIGALGLGFPIDIGNLICRYMFIARNHPQQSLPYSCLITRLLRENGVPIDHDEPSYTIPTRHQLSIQLFKGRQWEKFEGTWRIKPKGGEASSSKRARVDLTEEGEAAAAAGPSGGASSSSSTMEEFKQQIFARFDSLADSITTLRNDVTTRLDAQDQVLAAQDKELADIKKIFHLYMGD